MMRSETRISAVGVGLLLAILTVAPQAAVADMPYFFFDYKGVDFSYTVTAQDPVTTTGKVGEIAITDNSTSSVNVEKQSSGLNNIVEGPGNGDDFLLDSAFISNTFGLTFDVSLTADVIRNGLNAYSIVWSGAGLTGMDISQQVLSAGFAGSSIAVSTGNSFSFSADVFGIPNLGDPVLTQTDADPNDWSFDGDSTTNVGLDAGDPSRIAYDRGSLVEFQLDFDAPATLDEFFGQGQANSSADMKITVNTIPAPGATLLGMVGLIGVGWFRRRFA